MGELLIRDQEAPMEAVKKLRPRSRELLHFVFYAFPNLMNSRVPLDTKWQESLKELRQNGIVRVDDASFADVADHCESLYLARLQPGENQHLSEDDLGYSGAFAKYCGSTGERSWGMELEYQLSFKDPKLGPLLFD